MKDKLDVTLVQCPLVWEDHEANRQQLGTLLSKHHTKSSLIVLPEMFTTGFSMKPQPIAEKMDGKSIAWMKEMSIQHNAILTGSLIIEDNEKYYNRLVWMLPNGIMGLYDKRHLFSYAKEDVHFESGAKRLISQVNGWRVCTLICYDLRFPVWSRQQQAGEYDILIYVANWPTKRSLAWNTLLKARAIENQCYVIGVNRTGIDGNEIEYDGNSQVISPLGEVLFQTQKLIDLHTHTFYKTEIESVRTQFPFLADKDNFILL